MVALEIRLSPNGENAMKPVFVAASLMLAAAAPTASVAAPGLTDFFENRIADNRLEDQTGLEGFLLQPSPASDRDAALALVSEETTAPDGVSLQTMTDLAAFLETDAGVILRREDLTIIPGAVLEPLFIEDAIFSTPAAGLGLQTVIETNAPIEAPLPPALALLLSGLAALAGMGRKRA